MADTAPFHHRSNFKSKRKSHKAPGKSKPSANSKRFGRIAPTTGNPNNRQFRHCSQFHDVGKSQRKASAKEKRKSHREKLIKNKLKYFGKMAGGTPKIIALIALSPYSNTQKIKKHLLSHCGITSYAPNQLIQCQAHIGKAQKSNYIIYELQDRNDTFSMLDICKIADIILLVCSPKPEQLSIADGDNWNDCVLGLDDKSKSFCSLIKRVGGGGGTSIYGLYQAQFYDGLCNLRKNSKAQQCKVDPLIKTTFLKYLQFEFGSGNITQKNIRIFDCYDTQQLFRFMHSMKNYSDNSSGHGEWKQKRPHLLVQAVRRNGGGMLAVDGYLRGCVQLNVNRPVHITGYGDYLIDKIDGLVEDKHGNKEQHQRVAVVEQDGGIMDFVNDMVISKVVGDEKKCDEFGSECVALVRGDVERQDTLEKVASLDGLASQFDQTRITEEELAEIEAERFKRIEREKLEEKGLSAYNLDWIQDAKFDDDDKEYCDMELDEDDKEEKRADNEDESEDEFEFADEVDLDANVRAKDEFVEYRGLKQFYKTKWDKFELLPVEYSQIANIRDWKKALKTTKLKNILCQQSEENNLIECGKKIRIYIRGITQDISDKLLTHFAANKPLIIWSLLQHENKISVCHYLLQKHSNYEKKIEGLKTYTFDVGFRRFQSLPIFSDNSRGNKHLVKKCINDNQFVVASVYSEITYPPIGVLMFEDNDDGICAYGNLLSVDVHRLLIERKVLTGAAYRVQRRRAVIRYMFYNSDDVKYFKPIDLWTKQGLKGQIEEPIGDKGAMKCFFNSSIKQNDTVCLSLYKRVFPSKDQTLFNDQ